MQLGHHHFSRRLYLSVVWASTLTLLYLLFALPDHPQWEGSIGYLIESPLGMMLDMIMLLAMAGYFIHHSIVPSAPKYRTLFVAGAFAAGVVANGIFDSQLSRTHDYNDETGAIQFFACAVIAYCLYRLCMCLPPRSRSWLSVFFALLLTVFFVREGYHANEILTSGCGTEASLSVWGEIFMKCV